MASSIVSTFLIAVMMAAAQLFCTAMQLLWAAVQYAAAKLLLAVDPYIRNILLTSATKSADHQTLSIMLAA